MVFRMWLLNHSKEQVQAFLELVLSAVDDFFQVYPIPL